MPPVRRYPILLALLHQALHPYTDVAVALDDQGLWDDHGAAKQALVECRTAMARSTHEKRLLVRELSQVLLDPAVDEAAVRAARFARVPAPV
jgi:hypothetical protein